MESIARRGCVPMSAHPAKQGGGMAGAGGRKTPVAGAIA